MSGAALRNSSMRRRILIGGGVLLGAVVAAIALYHSATVFVTTRSDGRPLAATSDSSDALKFSFFDQPRVVPGLQFADADGRSLSLRDFRGRPILLNVWATWCVPCRNEMPALDRLQAKIGASQLLVLPLSIDRQGLPVVKKFYEELGLTLLGIYIDQSGNATSVLNTVGIPTTLLIDSDGREIARKIGPADWDGPEMVALIREHIGLTSGAQKASP